MKRRRVGDGSQWLSSECRLSVGDAEGFEPGLDDAVSRRGLGKGAGVLRCTWIPSSNTYLWGGGVQKGEGY
jgi:hypothetical protein